MTLVCVREGNRHIAIDVDMLKWWSQTRKRDRMMIRLWILIKWRMPRIAQ